MLRYIILVVSVSVSALSAVAFLRENPEFIDTAAVVVKDRIEARKSDQAAAVETASAPTRVYSGTERLRADARGHYIAEFMLNSRRVTGVIDTGATMIALGRSQARRAGIDVRPADFVYKVSTANGTVKAARAIIGEVRLGSIRVRDVEAMVLEDDSLEIVLIGMSFLKRLRNFEFANGMLEMRS